MAAPPRRRSGGPVDAAALMRLKTLELRARVVVEGFLSGLHRSPYHGFSAEFSEYRQYTPGDDLRYLDWRLYARSDRFYIKRFEDETNLACHLVVDLSRSMGFGTVGWSKAEYARTLAATFAAFLHRQRDAVGLLTFDEAVGEALPARFRPSHLHRLTLALERAEGGSGTDAPAALEQVAATVRRRGLVVLISDLLAPVTDLVRNLGFLRSAGHDVLVLRTLDPAEIEFDFDRATTFRDRESGREFFVDPKAAAKQYRTNFRRHADELAEQTRAIGVDLTTLRTDSPLDGALFDLLAARQRQANAGRPARAEARR